MRTKAHSPTAEEVLAALQKCEGTTLLHNGEGRYDQKPPDTGAIEQAVARMAGLTYSNDPYQPHSPIAAGAVRRQLEALAKTGTVIEVENRGGYGVHPKSKCWSTPEKEAQRVAARASAAESAKDRRARVQTISRRLINAGFKIGNKGYDVDLDDMERLVEMAGLPAEKESP